MNHLYNCYCFSDWENTRKSLIPLILVTHITLQAENNTTVANNAKVAYKVTFVCNFCHPIPHQSCVPVGFV